MERWIETTGCRDRHRERFRLAHGTDDTVQIDKIAEAGSFDEAQRAREQVAGTKIRIATISRTRRAMKRKEDRFVDDATGSPMAM
jgi:hypothetical protein